MAKETMTGRERWLAVLNRETPDRVPMDDWATAEADVKLKAHLGVATDEERDARLYIDRPLTVGGRHRDRGAGALTAHGHASRMMHPPWWRIERCRCSSIAAARAGT